MGQRLQLAVSRSPVQAVGGSRLQAEAQRYSPADEVEERSGAAQGSQRRSKEWKESAQWPQVPEQPQRAGLLALREVLRQLHAGAEQ